MLWRHPLVKKVLPCQVALTEKSNALKYSPIDLPVQLNGDHHLQNDNFLLDFLAVDLNSQVRSFRPCNIYPYMLILFLLLKNCNYFFKSTHHHLSVSWLHGYRVKRHNIINPSANRSVRNSAAGLG